MNKVLIIGACNIDYIGKAYHKIMDHDSNVGSIKVSFGGVARNVGENLARLGLSFSFITAIGNDEIGRQMLKQLQDLNVQVITPNTKLLSSIYMAIHDEDGDMVMALCDSDIIKEINPDFLNYHSSLINEFEYIIVDANLSEEALAFIFNHFASKKIIVEGISTGKVIKFIPYLDKVYLLKCNIYEAQALVKAPLIGEALIEKLHNLGISKLVVTNGSQNIYFYDEGIAYTNVIKVDRIVSATGAGDAMLAGIIYGIVKMELPIKEAVEFGKIISLLTLQVEEAVNEKVDVAHKIWEDNQK
jgi:pseudouridine kinase